MFHDSIQIQIQRNITILSLKDVSNIEILRKQNDADGFSAEQITDKIGLGYMVNENFTAGVQKGAEDAAGDATWDLFVRYNFGEGMWATLQMPTEEATDNMTIGVGYSFNVWNALYLEPSYTMPVNEDDAGDREGKLNFGLAYRF